MIRINVKKTLEGKRETFHCDYSLELEEGKLATLYGPSGAGKSTLLRMLAGLETPDEGEIYFNRIPWFDSKQKINLKVQKRRIGYLFQDYALFPNMSVRENLIFALDRKTPDGINHVDTLLSQVGVFEQRAKKPQQLSGGQKQRVALARALVRKPDLLLLDEPLSAIDPELRLALQDRILEMQKLTGVTGLMVSHDIPEIYKMSDHVFVVERGKILRSGSVEKIFSATGTGGKFNFPGRILSIEKSDIVYNVSVLIGNNIVRVIACEDEIQGIGPGDSILVSSKAFNPIISRLS